MEGNFAVHLPVMVGQVLDYLRVSEKGVYVDATLGLGGYSKEILSRLGAEGRLIGIDRDEDAINIARGRLGNGRVTLMRASFQSYQNSLSLTQ
jgi:16S rRNA (cytosine1402-N4)-methyltransferase